MSDSSDDNDDACDNYRIDMTHATFGTCNCGKPKSLHTVTTKAGAKKIFGSLEGKPQAGGGVTSKWQPQFQSSLLQKKAAAEESEFWKKQKAADEKTSAAVTYSSTFAKQRAAVEREGAVSQAPVAVVEQFRRQRRVSVAAVEDAVARKQGEVAQQQAAEQAKTAEAAGTAAAAEASAAKDEAASTAALLAQVEEMRRENDAIEAAQRAETAGKKEGAGAENEAQAELLAQIAEMRAENVRILKEEEAAAAAAQTAKRKAAEAPRHASQTAPQCNAWHLSRQIHSFASSLALSVPSAPLPLLCTPASPAPPRLPRLLHLLVKYSRTPDCFPSLGG